VADSPRRLAEARAGLATAGLDPDSVERLARAALEEDLSDGSDVTSLATVPADSRSTADVVARAGGVLAGGPVALLVLALVVPEAAVSLEAADGDRVSPGQTVLTATGPTRGLLTAERTLLNLVCHLSGVATLTARWVEAVAGSGAQIRDTRKTTPLMRTLEKYAVRCGGGLNHRMSLSDEALIKDNHVVAAGGVVAAYRQVKATWPDLPVQVEVDTLAQAVAAVEAGADLLLLDNMSLAQLADSVAAVGARARLEASGGLTLDRAAEVAATGVDYLAVGALTHSAPALDLGLDLREPALRGDG
jgi:nicotinate-nucleotide pyrophosphorylase (carboxylating)